MIHTSRGHPVPAAGDRKSDSHRFVEYACAAALALVLMLGMSGQAHANCSFNNGSNTGTYLVTMPTTITVDPNAAVGDTIYTVGPVGISPTVYFNCRGSGNAWGLQNTATANTPATNVDLFESGVTGVSYRISQRGSYIYPYPYFSLNASSSWQESDAITIELVKTGPISNGSLLLTGELARFLAGNGSPITDAIIQIVRGTTFVAPACTVTTKSITVTLPTVSSANFAGLGSVAGTTPFAIGLTCSSGTTLRIQLDSPASVAGKPGVIAPSSGGAKGVGVQLLDGTGTAVNFGSAQTVGATPNGNLSVNYFARYYQTGTPVVAGLVQASATFTLSYQ